METLKQDYAEISAQFPKAYINNDSSLLLVENEQGFAIVINRKHGGYQAIAEIEPNIKTGSAVGLTGDYWDCVSLESVVRIAKDYNGGTPRHIYSESDILTIKFQSVEQHLKRLNGLLGYQSVK